MLHHRKLTLTLPALTIAQIEAIFEFVTHLLDELSLAFEKEIVDLAEAQSNLHLRAQSRRSSPPLSGHDAYQLVRLFDQAQRVIYNIHGDAIADYLACVDPNDLGDCCGPDDPQPIAPELYSSHDDILF